MDAGTEACHPLPMAKKVKGLRGLAVERHIQERRKFAPIPLKSWFKKLGVKQREVAEAIKADESTLSLVAKGTRQYMRHHLEDIAAFLSQRSGREITPAMLLHAPVEPTLQEIIVKMTPGEQRKAAKMLEAFKGEPD